MKLVMMKGLQASGKSTYAKELVKRENYKRVNKDDLRAMVNDGKWSKERERDIVKIRDMMVDQWLKEKYNVVVDDTNFHRSHEANLRKIAQKHWAEFEVKYMDTDVFECIRRDAERLNGVGYKVIMDTYIQYVKNQWEQYIPNSMNPMAVIFDVDGTLAEMHNRHPYEREKVWDDKCIEEVKMVLNSLRDSWNKIIIMTWRDWVCKELTREWLAIHSIPYDEFHIRKAWDDRRDSIVKKEMFDSIKDKYYIWSVFDDRDQTTQMRREQGLQCFQCNYGNF